MKKTIPIMVAATVVCAMFAMMFVTTDVDATDAGLYLNGDLVSGTSSGEGWSYNADTKTLTLSGANFTTAHNETGMYTMSAPLYYGNEETLTIQLTGNNSITGVGTADENCGIFVRGSLVISGSGSLTVSNASYNEAIMAVNHIMISGGTITSASGPGQFDLHVADTDAEDGFLMTGGSLHLSGSGNMDVNGGAE